MSRLPQLQRNNFIKVIFCLKIQLMCMPLRLDFVSLLLGRNFMSLKKITKYDLVESIYQNTKCEKRIVQQVIEGFLEEVKKSLESGSTIELRGFGTFEPRLRKGRISARNPKTGEKLSVDPHYVAAFRSGQELKKALWDLQNQPVEK
jgi:nucleoid DNA-binding protein